MIKFEVGETKSLSDLIENLKKDYADKGFIVRCYDVTGYEHLSFVLMSNTDCSMFTNVFDDQMLDSNVIEYYIHIEQDYETIDIYCDIDL